MAILRVRLFAWLGLIAVWSILSSTATAAEGKRYHNNEFGVAMTFPAGSRVCPSESGDHVHGYYSRYYGQARTCDEMRSDDKDTSISAMGVYATYNANFESAQTNFNNYCKASESKPALSPAVLHRLSIKGHTSRSCVQTKPDGQIEIIVIAQGGTWSENDDSHSVPYIIYIASLATNAGHLKHDLPMFDAYLHSLRIYPRKPNH